MRLRCNQVSPVKLKNAVFLTVSMLVSGGALGAYAGDQADDSSHNSIIGVPSMPDGLSSPGASQFRYLKMDYAVRKDIEPDNKDEAVESAPPAKKPIVKAPEPSSTTTAQTGQVSSHSEGLRLDSHSAPLDLTPLNLTAEQKQKICDLHKENVKKARDLRKLLKTKKEDLATAMFDPDLSEAAIRDKRDTVRAAREQMEDLAFDEILKVRQLLNPDQKKHLAEIKPAQSTRPYWDGSGQDKSGESAKAITSKSDPTKSDQTKALAPGKIAEANKGDGVKSGGSKDASVKAESKAAKADVSKQ